MTKDQAKNLLMIPDDELLERVVRSINRKSNKIALKPQSEEKIVNKIIAYEYIMNNYIIDENSVQMLKQNVDGVWVSYTSGTGKQYAKVWFTSANPNLRKIFCGGKANENQSN